MSNKPIDNSAFLKASEEAIEELKAQARSEVQPEVITVPPPRVKYTELFHLSAQHNILADSVDLINFVTALGIDLEKD